MARNHKVSIDIYRRHIALFRYLNDIWIFINLLKPYLKERAVALRDSKSFAKRRYTTPKRGRIVESRRKDRDISEVYWAQYERGIYETNIVNIVSRVEAFIQECVTIAVRAYPEKLIILSEKSGVPLELFLSHTDRDSLLEDLVSLRCQDLMFGKPKEYLAKAFRVLAVDIEEETIHKYIEMKATRDVIIHNNSQINRIYLEKTNELARGQLGDELVIDKKYFSEVIMVAKELSGAIQREVENVYK